MPVPKTVPVCFASFSVLAKNFGRSCAVPLYKVARDVLDKVIIFHRPLNGAASLVIPPAGRKRG